MSLLLVFFLSLSGCLAVDNPIFYGGSMSFSTFHDDRDNTVKVHLKLLTGWKIGTGPCGRSCPRSRTRTSTIQTRKNMLDAKGDGYFGNWEMEVSKSTGNTYKQNLTTLVKTNLTEKVESVNPRLEWELDTADLFVPIPDHVKYVDIIFEGNSWLELTVNKLTKGPPWHLQVKINPHERSDTLGPNRSPIVQMKPFFKLGMNKTYAISLTAMDEDDDAIKCRSSQYVEAGSVLTSHRFHKANVDAESCTINIDTRDSSVFYENATGAIAVTVQDYARKLLKLKEEENLIHPYEQVLSAVTVQFFVFIVEHADEPIFVPPTHPNQQMFIIYVGVEFTVDFYARPTAPDANRKIELFDVTRTGGRETNHTDIKFITNRTAKITVSWIPVGADLGKDILCARVEDNEGFESINLHCFTILTKPYTPHPQTPLQARPYFVFFPQPGDIVFPEHFFCKFPIYAASSIQGGITNISIQSTDAPSAVVVGVIRPVNSTYGPGAKMVGIQLKEPVGGVRKICFEASDADSSTVQCLFANVLKKDPCEDNPCGNVGTCFSSKDHNDFFCHCNKGYTGNRCQRAPPNACQHQNTCLNNGRCISGRGGHFFCLCIPYFTGIRCENKVDKCLTNPCGQHGICIDDDTPSCNCTDGYTGAFCNTSLPTSAGNNCNGIPNALCRNEGICLIKAGQQKCICPVGFNGSACEKIVVENKLTFVPPTPEKGSTISCNLRIRAVTSPNCEFPVYIEASALPSLKSITSNPDLDVTILSSENFTLRGVSKVYMMPVKLSQSDDIRSGSIYEFCLQARLASEIASRCFKVDFEALSSPPRPLPKRPWDFIPPTAEKNTTFRCQLGRECHVVVYTFFDVHCEQVLVTNSLGGKAFPTKELNNKCVTDVVFTDVDSEGKHQVCLKSWKNGESRCYFVDAFQNIEDGCEPNPCENGGLCLEKAERPFCVCQIGFEGDNCTKGPCPSVDSHCKNGAFCFTNDHQETCFCPTGFSGPNCTHDSAETITDLQLNGAKFTDAAYPTNTTCYVSKPCKIHHIITGSSSKNPLLRPGYLSPGITIEEVKFEKHHNNTQVYNTVTTVKAETRGQKKVCLQIYNEQRLTSDEACFNLTVVLGFEHINPIIAHFIPPTPSNNTVMECEVGRSCHMRLWTSNKFGVNSCPFVKSSRTIEDGVYVFQEPNSLKSCVNDVSIQTSNTQVSQLCFSVFESRNSRVTGEKRCYQLEIVSTLTVRPLPTSSSVTSSVAVTTTLATQKQTSEQPVTTSDKLQSPLSLQGRPYFLSFPRNKTTSCVQNVLCTFNVYAISTFCRNINHIENVPNSEENVTIYFSTQMVGMMETKAGRVEFLPRTTGLRKICLKASDCDSFTQKCYHITVLKNNPCESSQCHNGGQCVIFNGIEGFKCSCKYGYSGVLCETKIRPCIDNNPCRDNSTCIPLISEPFYKCLCLSGKTGVKCEIDEGYRDACKNSSRCKNSAACYLENQSESCICRLGYSGPTCSIEAHKNLSHPVHTGAKFTNVALPKSVICYVAFPCDVPFTVTKSMFNKPIVVPGHTDTTLYITNYELDHETSAAGIVHGVIEVVGFSPGSASICIDSVDTAWKSRIEDEICFNVQVVHGNYYKQNNDVPHFVNPSFETNSMFRCLVGDDCHLNMWAVNSIKERDCPVLKSEKNIGCSVFVLPPLNHTLSPCIYDVAVISNTATNDTLCFYLEGDGGVVFDRRCYIIEITASMRKGSCANDICFNGGFCDGHTTTKKCLCRTGFSGENCSSSNGIPQAANQQNVHHPLFGNMVLPTLVVCPLNDECKLQLLVTTKTEFEFGINADPSNIEIIEPEEHRVSEDFLITLAVVHRKVGSHQLCVNLTSKTSSLVTDTHCINIFSKNTVTVSTACSGDTVDDCRNPAALQFICADPTTAEYCRKSCNLCDVQRKDEIEELFLSPSPTNTSAFSCSPGLECHMMLYLRRGYNDICPEVIAEPTAGAFISILNNSDCIACSVDVLIKLSLSHPGQRVQQCLHAIDNDFGVLEKRCFFLENVMHSST